MNLTFKHTKCLITNNDSKLVFEASIDINVYTIEHNNLTNQNIEYLSALDQEA